jgi:dual-specificity kinase
VEFYTGVALYQTHDNLEHLAMMEMVMGRMPDRFAHAGQRSKPEFFKDPSTFSSSSSSSGRGGDYASLTRLDWPKPKATRQSKRDVRNTRPLGEVIPPIDSVNREFLDLVRRLLAFDPAQRITVREALSHPYFSLTIPPEI